MSVTFAHCLVEVSFHKGASSQPPGLTTLLFGTGDQYVVVHVPAAIWFLRRIVAL